MQLQALKIQLISGRSLQNDVPFLRRALLPSMMSAGLLALGLSAIVGCGSGMGGSAPISQNIAVPTASAKGPQLGYLWLASDHSLRPILGVAGASQIGQAVAPAGVYSGAVSSASANLAILQGTDGSFDLMTLPSGAPASLGLTLPSGAMMRLSPTAAAALLYTPGAKSASLVTGLLTASQTPVQIQSIAVAGPITDSAVSDTGTASFEYAQGSSVAVTVVALNGRAVPLTSIKAGGGLSFLPGRDDLLFADAVADSLTLIRSTTSAPSTTLLQTSGLLNAPSAVGVSNSGRYVLVANSGSQSTVRIDMTTLSSTQVACSCKPTEAAVLADDGAFRVTNVATGPNWIVDAAAATPRTLFIPALPPAARSTLVASVVVP
jgi:hypothetical protein